MRSRRCPCSSGDSAGTRQHSNEPHKTKAVWNRRSHVGDRLQQIPRCRLTETERIRAWRNIIRDLVASTVREDSPETVAETLARRLARAYEPPVKRDGPPF